MNEFNSDINPILVFYECRSSCQKGPHFIKVQQILDEKLFHCKSMLNKHYSRQTQTKLSILLWQICTICMHSCLNIVNTFYKSNEHITKIIKVVKEKKSPEACVLFIFINVVDKYHELKPLVFVELC